MKFDSKKKGRQNINAARIQRSINKEAAATAATK